MDRIAQDGHDGWRDQSPAHAWGSRSTIAEYLRFVHDVLRVGTIPVFA